MKLVIYEFETVTCCWNLIEFVNGDIQNLYEMGTKDFLSRFGGPNRISTLKQHFEWVSQQHIHIILLSSSTIYYE